MINYEELAENFKVRHREIAFADSQLEAITSGLLGAIAEGYKVKMVKLENMEIKDIDLDYYKKIFNEGNLTVEELENALVNITANRVINKRHLETELDELVLRFNLSPNSFLYKYISIPNHVVNSVRDFKNRISQLISEKQKIGYKYTLMNANSEVMIFCKKDDDLGDFKEILAEQYRSCEVSELIIDDKTKYYLGYLYI